MPRLLSDDQKVHRVSVCRERKQEARDDPNFISSIITGHETWVHGYDPETSSSRLSGSCQIHLRQVRSNLKCMLIIVFDIQDIVHKEFTSPSQTVNGKFYCDVLKRLREGILRKRPDKYTFQNQILGELDM